LAARRLCLNTCATIVTDLDIVDVALILMVVLWFLGLGLAVRNSWRTFRGRKGVAAGHLALSSLISIVYIAMTVCAVYLFLPIQPHKPSKTTGCIDNVNQLNKALLMYAGDNNDRAPLGNWCDTLKEYAEADAFACPTLDVPFGYSLSSKVIGISLSDLDAVNTIWLFDSPGGINNVGDESDIDWRHNGRAVFGYADGHVRVFGRNDRPSLQLARASEKR
jgi:prepilin-type processing-associated H-X9-DG protein